MSTMMVSRSSRDKVPTNQQKSATSPALVTEAEKQAQCNLFNEWLIAGGHKDVMERVAYVLTGSSQAQDDDIEDIAQDAEYRAFRWLIKYRYDEKATLSTFVKRIATNLVFDRFRTQEHKKTALYGDELPLESVEEEATDQVFGEIVMLEEEAVIHTWLSILSNTDQLYLRLRYWEDCSYEEMSDRLGKDVGTIRTSLHRAIKRLREAIPADELGLVRLTLR